MNDDLDELFEELKTDESLTSLTKTQSADKINVNDDSINDFIMQKAGKLVEDGVDTIDAIKQTVLTSFEPDELAAYSDLIKSVVKAIDTMNKINLQNKKDKSAREIKKMDIELKKELPAAQGGNTNILVATREEIIQGFLEDVNSAKPIDIESEEEDEDESEE